MTATEPLETECPGWCDKHHRREHGDCVTEHHSGFLFVQRPPAKPDSWLYHVAVSVYSVKDRDEGHFTKDYAPAMSLNIRNFDIPIAVQPDAARELAAALLRGAEIVEAARTTNCPTCGTATAPCDLFDGECSACVVRANRRRRDALHVVDGGAR